MSSYFQRRNDERTAALAVADPVDVEQAQPAGETSPPPAVAPVITDADIPSPPVPTEAEVETFEKIPASPDERKARGEIDKREKELTRERKSLEAKVSDLTAKLSKLAEKLTTLEQTKRMYVGAFEDACTDLENPQRARDMEAEIKKTAVDLDIAKAAQAGMTRAVTQAEGRIHAIDDEVRSLLLKRVNIRLRRLHEEYNTLASAMGPVLLEIDRLLKSEGIWGLRIDELVDGGICAGHGVYPLASIANLPRVFFPGQDIPDVFTITQRPGRGYYYWPSATPNLMDPATNHGEPQL